MQSLAKLNGSFPAEILVLHTVLLRPSIKTLFVSGYAEAALIHQGIQDNSVKFLQKPFSPNAFASKVRAILDRPDDSQS